VPAFLSLLIAADIAHVMVRPVQHIPLLESYPGIRPSTADSASSKLEALWVDNGRVINALSRSHYAAMATKLQLINA